MFIDISSDSFRAGHLVLLQVVEEGMPTGITTLDLARGLLSFAAASDAIQAKPMVRQPLALCTQKTSWAPCRPEIRTDRSNSPLNALLDKARLRPVSDLLPFARRHAAPDSAPSHAWSPSRLEISRTADRPPRRRASTSRAADVARGRGGWA